MNRWNRLNPLNLLNLRLAAWIALGIAAVALAAGAAWLLSLPPATAPAEPPAIAEAERAATLAALKPQKRPRPVIAIVGINDATETTDYLMPYGILRRADIGEVTALATQPGPVKLYPVLQVEPDATIAQFDAQHPQGADYVLVPAMSRDDDPAVLQWIRSQAAKGATVIGICAGAKVVAAAGLLDGKRATTHWYYLEDLLDKHPTVRYVADRRIVVDGRVATTTGISASMPMTLTLIEAVAGRDRAQAVARDLGLPHWDARHDSDAFTFTRPFALTAIGNTMAFWNRERLGIALRPGVDEVSLALVADAWSRTYRSQAVSFAQRAGPIQTRNGIRLVPEHVGTDWDRGRTIALAAESQPARALDEALNGIGQRYGARTESLVAMQLEYPRENPGGHQQPEARTRPLQ
ncbi:transcriptional regulator [Cupriavidus sp. HPC(L)]|uniref:DJ-1/PfpI family protein n=1 Tax=Cupriavidus sp. HPC(L) TaxID=1217418 RepID=UPI0003BE83DD|nr:DJ-1/PfpI family protein [Cupriavidus sp. HPC(L)]ESJ21510.1 transcriptional regulator [Cupriavidus sp. HPC(L)]